MSRYIALLSELKNQAFADLADTLTFRLDSTADIVYYAISSVYICMNVALIARGMFFMREEYLYRTKIKIE